MDMAPSLYNGSIAFRFREAADTYQTLKHGAVHADPTLSQRNQEMLMDLMAERLQSINYSDDMQCSIKAASMDFAEVALKTPYFLKSSREWDEVRNDNGRLKAFAQTMQRIMTKSLSKHRGWGSVERKTSFDFFSQAPVFSSNGDKRMLKGEFLLRGVREMNDGEPRHLETIRMNTHRNGIVASPIDWLSTQLHENVHAIEAIERQRRFTMTDEEIASDRDIQILIADESFPDGDDFRDMCYKAYYALPRERLARMAQKTFEWRMGAETRLAMV